MKFSLQRAAFAVFLASEVSAFPTAVFEASAKRGLTDVSEENAKVLEWLEKRAPGFNAAEQYVSTEGEHVYVAPKNVNTKWGDQRGPCPGLNAMANHGYIPHNGVATINEFIEGTYKVFGMGRDLGGFLGLYGAIFDGNLRSWSIGGATGNLPSLPLLLSTPQGLSGSHNKYEADVSPTRGDFYQYGDGYKVIVSQFQDMFSRQPNAATANYDLDTLNKFRSDRFKQSIAQNKYFFNAPFSGVIVQPAAYTFIFRFMGNKSAEHPEGVLNQEVLKSFFGITGESGSFTWNEGTERIPNNWYKRAKGDEYTIVYYLSDLVAAALKYPEFLSIGGNTGTVNTFAGVDLTMLTGGVFNTATLLQSNNLVCFIRQILQGVVPDILAGGITPDGSILGAVSGLLNNLLGSLTSNILPGLTCPGLIAIDKGQFSHLPGFTKSPY